MVHFGLWMNVSCGQFRAPAEQKSERQDQAFSGLDFRYRMFNTIGTKDARCAEATPIAGDEEVLSKTEYEINAGHREPFIGFEHMLNSEIEGTDLPEGMEIKDYALPKAYGIVTNTPIFLKSSDHFAFFSNDADEDAINRWVTLVANINGTLMPSLALKSAAEYLNSEILVFFNEHQIEGITLVNREDEEDQ